VAGGQVLTDRGRVLVRAGDVLGFPPRYQVAHALANTGDAPLRYLVLEAPAGGQRAAATAFGKARPFDPPAQLDVPYWENEPVDEPLVP
jgi:uncharacterized cupin superfamily protein